jgi:hypothetical protein
MLLVVAGVVAFVWGLERWRQAVAHRAGRSEQRRLIELANCLLGPDGATLLRTPDAARQRLRALALATPAEPTITWFDRCVPLAQSLARHASEVDNSVAPTAAQIRLADSARLLAQRMARPGLVWRMRVGDPEADMDPVVEQLARVASEIDLVVEGEVALPAGAYRVAPPPPEFPSSTVLSTTGLEPLPVGTPTRFFVGGPLPAVAEVVREGTRWSLHTLANEPAYAWRASAAGVTRVDVHLRAGEDGLAPLRLFRPGEDPVEARVTPVNEPLEGLHVAMDAVVSGRALWLAQWTPWNGTGIARFVPGREALARTLAQADAGALDRALHPTHGRTTAYDERVALAPLGEGVVLAYTTRDSAERAQLSLLAAPADDDRTPLVPVTSLQIEGARSPSLEFCAREGAAPWLFVGGARRWLALEVGLEGVTELARIDAERGRRFDDRLTVRCTREGAVVYGRDHTRSSPLLACTAGEGTRCRVLTPPALPMLDSLPLYTTRTPQGRQLSHPEWPLAIVQTDGTLVAVQAAGPVVSLTVMPPGTSRWSEDRVLFDAAAHAHGAMVEGLDLYADDTLVTLAIAAPDGLHLLVSEDAGEHWN